MSIFSFFGKTYTTELSDNGVYYSSFSSFSPFRTKLWLPLFFTGLIFIGLGVLLIIHPELLAFFFAGILMFAGICMLSSALFIRKSSKYDSSPHYSRT